MLRSVYHNEWDKAILFKIHQSIDRIFDKDARYEKTIFHGSVHEARQNNKVS